MPCATWASSSSATARCARRFDAGMKAFFERLIAKGKPFKVAVTACARKLLVIINARLRDYYAIPPTAVLSP